MKNLQRQILFLTKAMICMLFTILPVYAQTPDWLWATSPNGVQGGFNYNMAVDSSGNVILTGPFTGNALTFGKDTVRNFGFDDMLTIKYDPNGNILWARNIGGSGRDAGSGVTTDREDNIYIIGDFDSGYMTFDDTTIYNAEILGKDMLIVKYDPDGNREWVRRVGGSMDVIGTGITTDKSGNLYVTGSFLDSTMIFGKHMLYRNNGKKTMFLVKYDSNGEVIWTRTGTGLGSITTRDIITDGNEDIYITGYYADSTVTFGAESLVHTAGWDIFLVKYNSNGEVLWARSGTGNRDDIGNSLIIDNAENIYLTGTIRSDTIKFGGMALSRVDFAGDIYITKYSSTGNPLWAKAGGGKLTEGGSSICIDIHGNIYITGSFSSPIITFDSLNVQKSNNSGDQDIFVVKYSNEGTALWLYTTGRSLNDRGVAIINDNKGNIYLTGYFQSDSITIGGTTLKRDVNGGHFLFLAKYGVNTTSILHEIHPKSLPTVFPNPTLGIFTISGLKTGMWKITVYNLIGESLYQAQFSGSEYVVDCPVLAKGIYFYKLQKENGEVLIGQISVE